MQLVLRLADFENNKYTVTYGNREALFTIINEDFYGNNHLGKINRITVLVREFDSTGKVGGAVFCTTVIGLGDGIVGVWSENQELWGKLLNRDNMEECMVELYENE
jgi:hypothetical protein